MKEKYHSNFLLPTDLQSLAMKATILLLALLVTCSAKPYLQDTEELDSSE